jgi:hypothetical protein
MHRFCLTILAAFLTVGAVSVRAEEPAMVAARKTEYRRDFSPEDKSRDQWANAAGQPLQFCRIDAAHADSLAIPVSFPATAQIWRGTADKPVRLALAGSGLVMNRLEFQVFLPPEIPVGTRVQARLLLKTKDGFWFEALGQRFSGRDGLGETWETAGALYPGWNRVRVDLSHNSSDLRPRGHRLNWSRHFLSLISSIGFSFQGNGDYSGRLALDDIVTRAENDGEFPHPLSIVNFDPGQTIVGQMEKVELTFEVNRPLFNPFSSKEIEIDATFRLPEGKGEVLVPAFYYQPYLRARGGDLPGRNDPDSYTPAGAGVFKIRFSPRHAGEYKYVISARYRSPVSGMEETVVTPPRVLTVKEKPARGFLRVSPTDLRCFEFENGEYFFPLGHSFRSPTDPRHTQTILRRDFCLLAEKDVTDWQKLCARLAAGKREPEVELSARIWKHLPEDARALIEKIATSGSPAEAEMGKIISDLNQVIRAAGAFRWTDVEKNAQIWELGDLAANKDKVPPKVRDKWRARRVLLELLCPEGLRQTYTRDQGLRAYEELLPRMKAAGLNSFEAWMCSWWLGLEWTSQWKNYHGLNIYNMENAWKLDRLVELAAENGLYLHLVIDNHGKAAQKIPNAKEGQCDFEWQFSPYNRDNLLDGGFLNLSQELFSSEKAKEYYRDKMRYIAARYGWSANIYGFELWSELDLVGHILGRHREIYATDAVRQWHREMTDVLHKYDHGRHLITTHYSGDHRYIDREMVALPFISYMACDAYHPPKNPDPKKNKSLLELLTETEQVGMLFLKPYQVTEFGGDWNATSLESLEGDLYGGLWFGWMSRMGGAPQYWWFELVAQEDYYQAYAAYARFIRGEDKRRAAGGPQLRTDWPRAVEGEKNDRLLTLALADGDRFYFYLCDREQIGQLPVDLNRREKYENISLVVANLKPGTYLVEAWDCWKGTVVRADNYSPDADGKLKIALPPFTVQAALKIRRMENEPATEPSSAETPKEKPVDQRKAEEEKMHATQNRKR